jgi:hypothetical protein
VALTDSHCALRNCHFTSIGAQVTAAGKTRLEVAGCNFPSKNAQLPHVLPCGARLALDVKVIPTPPCIFH